jgi:hypothetical protein
MTERALEILRSRVAMQEGRAVWSSPSNVLIRLLMAEGRLPEAWAVVRASGCSEETLKSLAQASEETCPSDALDVYAQLVEQKLRYAAQHAYESACQLIERMRIVRNRLDQSPEHQAWVEALAARHKAKRNFLKLLRAPSSPR